MINFNNLPKPFIIAEIGNNHEGSLANAVKLIKAAKNAGAHAVKFQVIIPEKLSTPKDKERIKLLKKFSLKKKEIIFLKKLCDNLNIIFFATPFDVSSAIFLNKIQNFFKIASGDNNYFDLIKKIRSFNKPVIISTGLMNYDDIKKLVKYFKEFNFYKKKENFCIMHCVSSYPASNKNINLNSIPFLKQKFSNVTIGYSDHTIGYKVACLSYVLGAEIIEKHFTLSNNFSNFRDHKLSLNLNSFKKFVNRIDILKKILGNYEKTVNIEEKKNIFTIRRKIVYKKNMKSGSILKKNLLLIVRSSKPGVFASDINKILNKKIISNVKKYDNLILDHLEK